MRYYIANENCIPLREQPSDGYTKLQVIARVQREIDECVKLFGGTFADHKDAFTILDSNFHEATDLYSAI